MIELRSVFGIHRLAAHAHAPTNSSTTAKGQSISKVRLDRDGFADVRCFPIARFVATCRAIRRMAIATLN
ncbi:MAG: hypothetical protein IPK83_23995 [Planctomycetes bacterium]|nr:hypothetical protein [Planctomycetota bacterium]